MGRLDTGGDLVPTRGKRVGAARIDAPGDSTQQVDVDSGALRNIRPDGAFVTGSGRVFAPGSGLHLDLVFAGGLRLGVFARVVASRPFADPEGPAGYAVEFLGLDGANANLLKYHLDSVAPGARPSAEVRVSERYRIVVEGPRRLRVRLGGALGKVESERFAACAEDAVAARSAGALFVFLDVQHLEALSRASLEHVRRWVDALQRRGDVVGVVVGTSTLGVGQVHRLLRDSGLANAFASFTDAAEAESFWSSLEEAADDADLFHVRASTVSSVA